MQRRLGTADRRSTAVEMYMEKELTKQSRCSHIRDIQYLFHCLLCVFCALVSLRLQTCRGRDRCIEIQSLYRVLGSAVSARGAVASPFPNQPTRGLAALTRHPIFASGSFMKIRGLFLVRFADSVCVSSIAFVWHLSRESFERRY
jgi:hypothetical protein